MEGQKKELKMIRMSEVESQEVKWLRYPYIPYGKLTIIQGDPGWQDHIGVKYCSKAVKGRKSRQRYECAGAGKGHLSDSRGWIGRYSKAEA